MKITISITTKTGDTLVERLDILDICALEHTEYYATNKVLDGLGAPILRMMRTFQKVADLENLP